MRRTFRLSAVSILAIFASGVLGAFSAQGESGGHFSSEVEHTIIEGELVGGSTNHWTGFGTKIVCTSLPQTGTGEEKNPTEITVSNFIPPECSSGGNPVTITTNGCDYLFTVGKSPQTKHNTMHIVCPIGKKIDVVIPGNCTFTLPSQTPAGGLVYTSFGAGSERYIEVDTTLTSLKYEKHGPCVFLSPFGTGPHTGIEVTGRAIGKGFDTGGKRVGIEATG